MSDAEKKRILRRVREVAAQARSTGGADTVPLQPTVTGEPDDIRELDVACVSIPRNETGS